jgi:hypothetical protein
MAKSTGIILAATGISFANDWFQSKENPPKPNLRIPVAGLIAVLICDGVEKISEPIGVGLSILVLVTVMLTPMHGHAPADTLIKVLDGK